MDDKTQGMIERLIAKALYISGAVGAFWKLVDNKILKAEVRALKQKLADRDIEIERLKTFISGMDRR